MPHKMQKPSPVLSRNGPLAGPTGSRRSGWRYSAGISTVSVEALQDTRAAEVQADHDEPISKYCAARRAEDQRCQGEQGKWHDPEPVEQ